MILILIDLKSRKGSSGFHEDGKETGLQGEDVFACLMPHCIPEGQQRLTKKEFKVYTSQDVDVGICGKTCA